jgi:hypothetical protein
MKHELKGLKARDVIARAVASPTSGGPGSSAMDTKPCKGVIRVTQSPSNIEFTQGVSPLQGGWNYLATDSRAFSPGYNITGFQPSSNN